MTTKATAVGEKHTQETTHRATELLIVGTLGGGGIHQYVEEQAGRLPDHLSVTVYDMASDSTGSGLVWFVVSLLRSLWAALKFPFRSPPDVVHVHSSHRFSFYRAAFYVLYARHVWGCPIIFHVHGSSFDDFVETDDQAVRWLQSTVFDRVDRVVVLSAYWRDLLTPQVATEKIEILPNSVDPDEYDPEFGQKPPHIVFVSNLIERKGVPELIEALDMLSERGINFRASIAGKGRLSDGVSELAERHDHIDYLGYVSEARKRELLETGSIYVLPTHAEGLPIAMLEGMAGGNAIVSTGVGSIPEVIDDRSGTLVDPGDTVGLADAIEGIATAPEVTESMARRNRDLIETDYSWDRTVDRLTRMYADEMERTSSGG